MVKSSRVQLIAVLAIGGLLGYAAASSRLDVFGNVDAGPSHQAVAGQTANSTPLILDRVSAVSSSLRSVGR